MPTLDFKGKPFVYSHHLSVPFRELIVDAEKSLPGAGGPSLNDNLIIHGDNLEALKALLPRYAGKVDVIYIDPPYNTGNEGWAYNDNVNSPLMREWLGKVVDKEDLERHDKWLCMMWPRLQLLHELLSTSGVMWINLDDNELHHARLIMDEIFGANCFVATCIWQKIFSPKNTAQFFSEDHDYILVYAKDPELWRPRLLPRTEAMEARYRNPDNDPRGPWTSGDLSARNYYSEGTYVVETPSGRVIPGPPKGMYWRVNKAKLEELNKDNRIWWGEDGGNVPRLKRFLSEVKEGKVPQTIWMHSEVGNTQEAKKELLALVDFNDSEDVFITPKPARLLNRILELSAGPDAIVLDSFAGSGTTAHSVAIQNAVDNGQRRFILVEMEDYASSLTAERIRRVIKRGKNSDDAVLQEDVGGSFTYCTLGDPIDLERFFEGEGAPEWEQVARYVAYTATGQTLTGALNKPGKDWFVGEAGGYRIHLIYKPDLEFMRSNEAALDMQTAERIQKASEGKPVLVYAAAKFMSQKALSELGLTFCQLPYSIHRILGDGPDEA
jgi:adenine-specific DNA-methyltransferase